MKTVSFRIPDELKNKVEDAAERREVAESVVMRDALSRGMEFDDAHQDRMMIETLCLLRRLVADKDPELWQKAKKDAAAIMIKLGIELEE